MFYSPTNTMHTYQTGNFVLAISLFINFQKGDI